VKNKEFSLKLPVPIGGVVYDTYFPSSAQVVIGYRIGRMTGEDDCEYEDGYPEDCAYVQYAMAGVESSAPITEFGRTIFLTEEESKCATQPT